MTVSSGQLPENEQGQSPLPPQELTPFPGWVECLRHPVPTDPAQRIFLVQRWLAEPAWPVVNPYRPDGYMPLVRWLLGDQVQMQALFQVLASDHPPLAEQLVAALMAIGVKSAENFKKHWRWYYGATAAQVAIPTHRSITYLALRVQGLADQLGIPIDPQLRIGDLPYL